MNTARALFGIGFLGASVFASVVAYRKFWGKREAVIPDRKEGVPKPSGGGGASSPSRMDGRPPNLSGDSEGYNTDLFPNHASVREVFFDLGYPTDMGLEGQVEDEVTQAFQEHWNLTLAAIMSGKIPAPNENFRGALDPDSVPGERTLSAAEVVKMAVESGDIPGWQALLIGVRS